MYKLSLSVTQPLRNTKMADDTDGLSPWEKLLLISMTNRYMSTPGTQEEKWNAAIGRDAWGPKPPTAEEEQQQRDYEDGMRGFGRTCAAFTKGFRNSLRQVFRRHGPS
jgi:hypothetical protein